MRVIRTVLVGALILFFPFTVFAVPRAVDVLRTPDEEFVTRGEFIRAAVKVLGFSLAPLFDPPPPPPSPPPPLSPLPMGGVGEVLPFQRIPRALEPYVRVAHEHGALEPFGSDLLLGRPIKRGEALIVLVELMGVDPRPHVEDVLSLYRDVRKGSVESDAVQVAVERNWLKPLTAGLFGVQRNIAGQEARLLLSRLAQEPEAPQSELPKIRVHVRLPEIHELPGREILRMIWQILNDQFLYDDRLNADEAAFRAAEAIIGSVNEPYTTFMRPRSAKEFQRQIQGEVSGIGAQVEYVSDILTIVAPLPGSPAERQGLKPGDQILQADGETLSGIGFIDAVDKVRGLKGTTVQLRIRRDGAEFDVPVIRDTIKVPELDLNSHDGIAVLKLIQFGRITETELRDVLKEVQESKPKGLILDMRNNPGGLLHAATVVLSNFLPEGSVVAKIKTRDGETKEVTEDPPTIDQAVSMVVLVNKGSASASEIVAGALQDAKRATIVGEKTFGKGTVQQVLEFTDGSSLKLTIAEWLTPLGRKIDGSGVTPDIHVESSDGRDEQMIKALQLLR